MALGLSASKIKDTVDKVVSTNLKIIEAQGRYAEGLIKRNTAVMVEIADERLNSFQDLASAKSFTELYENSLAFEGTLRDKIIGLYQDNSTATKELGEEVKDLLEIDQFVTRVKDLSDDIGGKVKDFSDTAASKVKSLSDSAIAKVKDLSSFPGAETPAPTRAKAKTATRKVVEKKAPAASDVSPEDSAASKSH
ncbi:MAG: hypothetical protein WC247_04155 [Porticoccaceae bacterium]